MYVAKGEKLAPQQITDVCIFFFLKLDNKLKKKTKQKEHNKFTHRNPSSIEKYPCFPYFLSLFHHIADYSFSAVNSLELCASVLLKKRT